MREYHPPVLDLGNVVKVIGGPEFSPGWRSLTEQFDSAMRSNGLFYIANTGVPESLIPALRTRSLKYFGSSPTPNGRGLYGAEGFTPVRSERISNSATTDKSIKKTSTERDIVESLLLHTAESDACPAELRSVISDYLCHMQRLLKLMLRLMTSALNVEPHVILGPFEEAFCTLKLSHYPPRHDGTQGYGAHRDFAGFTILSQDDSCVQGALQVLLGDNSWATVPPMKGMLLVNAGELIAHWTNGVYKSPVHRVVLAPNRSASRISIVYFTGPSDNTVVKPLDTCCDDANPPRYAPVVVGDWIKRKLKLTNSG